MILSDRHYAVTLEQVTALERAIADLAPLQSDNPELAAIERDALASQISTMRGELEEYDLLKSGAFSTSGSFSLTELPVVLIQARIAAGLSQSGLAERIGLKPQQVQRYEASAYMSASLARLIEVAAALNVRVTETFVAHDNSDTTSISWRRANDIDWNRFPVRELARRRWIQGTNLVHEVEMWFQSVAGPELTPALHRKVIRSSNSPNEYALLAWQARVLELSKWMRADGLVGEFSHDDRWLSDLVKFSALPDGPTRARDLLAEKGIALVVLRHLPGTYLDGAAMLDAEGAPIVALSLRYDRLDNFWFVLLHELAHVFLHLHGHLPLDFFDDDSASTREPMEKEANDFAAHHLVADADWVRCLSRFARSHEAVELDAKRLGVGASILAGRIRRALGDYSLLSEMVGNGTVRIQLEGVG